MLIVILPESGKFFRPFIPFPYLRNKGNKQLGIMIIVRQLCQQYILRFNHKEWPRLTGAVWMAIAE